MTQHDHSDTQPMVAPGHSDVAVRARPKKSPARPKRKVLPPFKLLLHNDPVSIMDDVVLSIVKLTPLTAEQAIRKMLEAHLSGTSLLLVTHKERGELYVQQFASMKITTTLEPDA